MRARQLGPVLFVVLMLGCGTPAMGAIDAGPSRGDAGPLGGSDSGTPGVDAGPGADSGSGDTGPRADAGVMPEVCTGGLDEDGDTASDCADNDCWTFADCVAADVAHMVPGLVPCGDAIEVDNAASSAACAMIGTPATATYPTDCATGSLTAAAHVYCNASGAPAALWLEERLITPETTEMLGPRRFRRTSYERASVIDWERQQSGFGAREGGTGFPVHETQAGATGGGTLFTVITVRPVMHGDVLSRLLGMQFITSIIDFDLPMSMDTRSNTHLGGLIITVPTP